MIYRVYLPRAGGSVGFPVESCGGQATMCTNLWIHFVRHHVRNTIVMMEEGNRTHPRFSDSGIFLPWAALNHRHPTTDLCDQGADWKRRKLSDKETHVGAATYFRSYIQPLETVIYSR